MRKLIATLALALALIAAPTGAAADYGSGSYNTSDGPSCFWSGGNGFFNVQCSGYSMSARAFVSYSCDVTKIGYSSSWNCRSTDGRSWSGSN